jgi:hypothetical protein
MTSRTRPAFGERAGLSTTSPSMRRIAEHRPAPRDRRRRSPRHAHRVCNRFHCAAGPSSS